MTAAGLPVQAATSLMDLTGRLTTTTTATTVTSSSQDAKVVVNYQYKQCLNKPINTSDGVDWEGRISVTLFHHAQVDREYFPP